MENYQSIIDVLRECGCNRRIYLCWTDCSRQANSIAGRAEQRYAWLMKRHIMTYHPDIHVKLMDMFKMYMDISPVAAVHEKIHVCSCHRD